jgi:hypothetical protein
MVRDCVFHFSTLTVLAADATGGGVTVSCKATDVSSKGEIVVFALKV